jgi:glycosyl transferase family 25
MNVFIITLIDRDDRLAHAENLALGLVSQGFSPTLLSATRLEGREFSEIRFGDSRFYDQPMTAGELACAWSHYRACRAVLESGEGAFILEDDAVIPRDLTKVYVGGVTHLLSGSYCDHNILRHSYEIKSTHFEYGYHRTVGLPYGTLGYYLTVEGARVLTEHLLPIRWASDIALDRLSKAGILQTQLAIEPWAVQHGEITSYIGPR